MIKSLAGPAALLSVLLSSTLVIAEQGADPLVEANRLFEGQEYQAAADAYRAVLDTPPSIPTAARAWFNLGLTYQALDRHDEAIAAFSQIFLMNVDDRESGGHIMDPYRNYRSRAQWQVGHSLFAKGDYKGALQAYLTTKLKYPFQSWCNVEQQVAEEMYARQEGLTYEHLGLYREAVDAYLRVYAPRLVDLYEAAGQLDDLKRIIAQRTQASASTGSLEFHPSQTLHDMLQIHTMAEAHAWPPLLELLRDWSKGSGNGRQNYLAKILARSPQEVFPLLNRELAVADGRPQLVYLTMGLMGTREAVAALKSRAATEGGIWLALSLVHALSIAGELGQTALGELDKSAQGNLRIAIDHLKSGRLQRMYGDREIFPSIPAKLVLPNNM